MEHKKTMTFSEAIRHFLVNTDPNSVSDDDPTYLPLDEEGDKVIGPASNDIKLLEAARRYFRDQYTSARRRMFSFMGLHYGKLLNRKILANFEKHDQEIIAARSALGVMASLALEAMTQFAKEKLDVDDADDRQKIVFIRRGWLVVYRTKPDERNQELFVPEAEDADSPLAQTLPFDTAHTPESDSSQADDLGSSDKGSDEAGDEPDDEFDEGNPDDESGDEPDDDPDEENPGRDGDPMMGGL